jgi:lycopene cyclase domain-containing protein
MKIAHSYFFVEVGLLLSAAAITWRSPLWRDLVRPIHARRIVGLTALWWAVDVVAVHLGFWHFPSGRTLPFRAFGLPLEEFLGLFTHTLVTFALVRFFGAHESVVHDV